MSVQFVKDKAREISYALVRVAFYVKRDHLRSKLEDLGVELLEKAARVSVESTQENVSQALATVSVLDGLVRLSHSVYEIEPVNATILIRELDSLNSAILRQAQDKSGNVVMSEELPDLETFFRIKPDHNPDLKEVLGKEDKEEKEVEIRQNSNSAINVTIRSPFGRSLVGRQSAIINRVKSGNGSGCRLKDLLAEFPDVSERTLRYDLQRLCEQGVIERMGNGGPASYYAWKPESEVLKQESSVIN